MENANNLVQPSNLAAQILEKTHYGTNIYSHILREYYPGEISCQREQNSNSFEVLPSSTDIARSEIVMKIVGRDCGLCRNPFNDNKETLHVWIEKFDGYEIAKHEDTENTIPSGDVFDFAEFHFKQQGEELLQTINKELFLHIGEKINFYRNAQKKVIDLQTSPTQSLPLGEVGGACFSFFRAPISNTTPLKSISLIDTYKYIIGDYAKQRTEKLRSILSPLSCGEGSGERLKEARFFKAANFDYCTFSGTFSNRNDKELIKHSQLLCIDFDHLKDIETLFKRLLNDEYFDTQLLFRSPSGDGLKWIIPIDISETTHGNFFSAVANYIQQTYGVEVDKSGKDISRACFLPYDPQAFINPLIRK